MEQVLEALLTSLMLMAEDLKQKTRDFRHLLGITDGEKFPVLRALEHNIGQVDGTFTYQIVEDADWDDPGIGALYSPADDDCPLRVVYIKASLFARAERGDRAALADIAHELCHWYDDFRFGIRVPDFITDATARRVVSHIIELRTNVFTCYVFPHDAPSEGEQAESLSGSAELDDFVHEYEKFVEWRDGYVTGSSETSCETAEFAMENARQLSDRNRA